MYSYLCYFVIYAFLGWCLEVSYKAVTAGYFVNRGFLNGPVCPIYGFGMVIVIWILTPIINNPAILFIGAVILTSLLEWLTGFILEKAFHAKWWDYSDTPFNISGYICLKFSLAWGLGCMLIMNVVQPFIAKFVAIIPVFAGRLILAILLAGMLSDAILTVNTVLKLNKQLRRLTEVGAAMRRLSDDLGENIFESVSDIKEYSEKLKDVLEEKRIAISDNIAGNIAEAKEAIEARKEAYSEEMEEIVQHKLKEMEELKANYDKIKSEKHLGEKRLLHAFPNAKHINHSESFEHIKTYLNIKKM